MRIIKSYKTLADSLKGNSGLPYDCDIACAEFRSFYQTASIHVARVRDARVRAVMLEVVTTLQKDLLKNESVLELS